MEYLRLSRTGQTLIRGPAVLAVAALLCASTTSTVQAQVSGTVVSTDGLPLSGVAMELWAGSDRLATKSTGPDGAFNVLSVGAPPAGALTLTARKIGFRPVSRTVERGSTDLKIALATLPSMLAEVSVTANPSPRRDPCTRKPSAVASAIFARAASYYRDDTRWLDRIARYAHTVRVTDGSDRDSIVGVSQRGGWTRNSGLYDGPSAGNSTAVPRRLSAAERLALPFPIPERERAFRGLSIGWSLPRFHEWASPSFVSTWFVDSMPKAVVYEGREGIVLAFCPSERRIPYTSGEIELGRDSTIIVIRWHFVFAKPADDAGGLALFAAPESRAVRAHLLPTNAITWTRVPASRNFEITEYSYGRWLVADLGEAVRAIPP
jgi:hypothetical protein